MKFYDETKPLYLETDTSRIALGAALLQTRDGTSCPKDSTPDNTILQPIAFASKSLTSTECRYRNIEKEALGILHGLKRFYHYCFAMDIHVITDHKPLVAILKKDLATLSQKIQHILLRIHQYTIRIIYKPEPEIILQIGYPNTTKRWGDKWKRHKGRCSADINQCPWLHVNQTYTMGNHVGWASTAIKIFYNCRVAGK